MRRLPDLPAQLFSCLRPRPRQIGHVLGFVFLSSAAVPSQASCFEDAAAWYGVNVNLLYAIAKTESGLNPKAINRSNRNGSYDIGMMQINSSWLPALRKYGITENQLYDACTSIQVGAWILAQNIQKMGVTWNAVGAYNARDAELRLKYARRVYKNIPREAIESMNEQDLIVRSKSSGEDEETGVRADESPRNATSGRSDSRSQLRPSDEFEDMRLADYSPASSRR